MKAIATAIVVVIGAATHTINASALTVPDSGQCNTNSTCLSIANQSTGSAATGIFASVQSGIGIEASSEGIGGGIGLEAFGPIGVSGIGIDGAGAPGTGVYGQTGPSSAAVGVYGTITPAGAGTGVYGNNNSSSGWAGYFNGRMKVNGIPYSSTQTVFTLQSDARLKQNIQPLVGSLDRLLKLKGVTFEWKDPAQHGNLTGRQTGFIAQDVEKVIPEWVSVDQDGYKNITTRGLEAMLVESIRALKAENDTLRNRVTTLEERRSSAWAGLSGVGPFGLGIGVALGGLFLGRKRRESSGRPREAADAAA